MDEKLNQIAGWAAKKANGSRREQEDLFQRAWEAILETKEKVEPGRDPLPYLSKAALYACYRHNEKTIRDRTKVDQLNQNADRPMPDDGPEVAILAREQAEAFYRWRQAVRREVRRILAKTQLNAEVQKLILRSSSAAAIAQVSGTTTARVYRDSYKLRRAFRESEELVRLMKERP